MDPERAKELAQLEMSNVLFNNGQYYIEHIDHGAGLATIHPIDNPEDKQMVDIKKLMQ
jgi:small acid-soluble spore protein H (minor)